MAAGTRSCWAQAAPGHAKRSLEGPPARPRAGGAPTEIGSKKLRCQQLPVERAPSRPGTGEPPEGRDWLMAIAPFGQARHLAAMLEAGGARADPRNPASRLLETWRDSPALIIDVRMNPGGSSLPALSIAARFVDEPRTYEFVRYRNGPAHSDLTSLQPHTVVPRGADIGAVQLSVIGINRHQSATNGPKRRPRTGRQETQKLAENWPIGTSWPRVASIGIVIARGETRTLTPFGTGS